MPNQMVEEKKWNARAVNGKSNKFNVDEVIFRLINNRSYGLFDKAERMKLIYPADLGCYGYWRALISAKKWAFEDEYVSSS